MPYQVKLEVFEGPFDLLLHLIAKRELDIYDVSLAAITEEYLEHLKHMENLDLEVATEFLVVAATLIEIKANRLLPTPPPDEDSLAASERDVLIARLLEYRAFKDAAAHLAQFASDNAGYLGRDAGPGTDFAYLIPDVLARVTPQRLADIAVNALTPKPLPHVDTSHITPIRVSVGDAAREIAERVRRQGSESFRALTHGLDHRLEVIVRFLGVLELVKRGYVDVTQSGTFGQIEVRWIAAPDAEIEDLETEDGW